MKWPVIAHPLLFAAFPILAVFQHNLGQIVPQTLGRPLAIVLAATLVLWGLLALLCRNAVKAGIIVSLFWVLFFSFGPVREVLMQVPWEFLVTLAEDPWGLMRVWILLFLLASTLCLASRRPLAPLNAYLNVVALLLVILPLYRLTFPLLCSAQAKAGPITLAPAAAAANAALPNIFFIVLDAYAREDVLREVYGYDNREFLSYLTRKGFYVANRSRTNYAQTVLTLGASLNMRHVDELVPGMPDLSNDRTPLLRRIANSEVAAFLRSQGYRTAAVTTGYLSDDLFHADRTIIFDPQQRKLTEFERMLLRSTVLRDLPINDALYTNEYELHWRRLRHAFNHLDDLAEGDGPVFGLAHLACPHGPFVFDEHGNYMAPDSEALNNLKNVDFWGTFGRQGGYLQLYPPQLTYTNTAMRGALNRLIARSRRPTVIVLLSDHGPAAIFGHDNLIDLTHPTVEGYRERMSILCAVYTSDGTLPGLYDTITPVNLFPLVLNHYFHADLPLHEDASYFSSYKYPYRFIDVTALVTE